MSNAVLCLGTVDNTPELRVKGEERRVTFNMDLSFKGKNCGWIRVICLKENAEFAAKLQQGMKLVVFGRLTRGIWETGEGEECWWDEILLIASYLEVPK